MLYPLHFVNSVKLPDVIGDELYSKIKAVVRRLWQVYKEVSIVSWTPSAIQDLEAIFDFIANSSPDNAAMLIDEIISVGEKIRYVDQFQTDE